MKSLLAGLLAALLGLTFAQAFGAMEQEELNWRCERIAAVWVSDGHDGFKRAANFFKEATGKSASGNSQFPHFLRREKEEVRWLCRAHNQPCSAIERKLQDTKLEVAEAAGDFPTWMQLLGKRDGLTKAHEAKCF